MNACRGRAIRSLLVAVLGLVLAVTPAPAEGGDDKSGVCVGGLEIVACVPPET